MTSKPRPLGDLIPSHLPVTAADLYSDQPGGRLMFLPGSPERAKTIASHFVNTRVVPGTRGFDVHLGELVRDGRAVCVGAVATGMGCPSMEIVASELIALGAERLIRVGTAGSLQPEHVKPSHVVIASAAVRDAASCDAYAPREVPAVASPEMVRALVQAARNLSLADETHVGLIHTKDSFYAREFGFGPLGTEHARYMTTLGNCGVLASEMEAAQLFLLGQVYSTMDRPRWTGCIVAIVGDTHALGDAPTRKQAEERAIDIALEAAFTLE